MKLLRAEFQNFRLLREAEIKFSTDPTHPLTVIRAANESGKTTLLHALQWALYGDMALPGRGDGFRLHPIDWTEAEGPRAAISVTVDFELTEYSGRPGQMRESHKKYRIVRTTHEDIDATIRRPTSTVLLFRFDDTGSFPIDSPETLINAELPPELREIFFTDGDRALSFIEADVSLSTKRERVQKAIRSLLGLGVIQDALNHVRKAAAEVNKKARQMNAGSELSGITTRLEAIEQSAIDVEAELEDAKQQFTALDIQYSEMEKSLSAALQKGDKESLERELVAERRRIKSLDDQILSTNKDHSALFRSRELATDLLAPVFSAAFEQLDVLYDQGKIPNSTIPVLEERLKAELCICGESLKATNEDGKRRRKYIQVLIDESEKADEVQELITDLYFGAKQLVPAVSSENGWSKSYKDIFERWDALEGLRKEAGTGLRKLEMEVAALPDTNIQAIRQQIHTLKEQRDRFLAKRASAETKLEALARDKVQFEVSRDRLLRQQKKGAVLISELEVINDVQRVLDDSYERITNDELMKVSNLMNSLFLEMIGSDPEQGAIIQRAEISPEFDILVFGPNGRMLNPDRDLNGASRRALTFAFILALTKVSEVVAPNVVDTPLGMTSGFVRRSILSTIIRESGQPVLFLTHAEIAGCEDIIDAAAGAVTTFTNPTHYPLMLMNDPAVKEFKVLVCECDHRNDCELCRRRPDGN